MKSIRYFFLLAVCLGIFSCKDSGGDPEVEAPELPPVIAQINPQQLGAGSILTITGTHLAGVTRVYFNTVAVNPESRTSGQVRVMVPILPEGSYSVAVENSAGRSNQLDITVLLPQPGVIERE